MLPSGRIAATITSIFATVAALADPQPARAHGGPEAQAPQHSLPPPPTVTYGQSTGTPRIEHGERIVGVDEARKRLHAQHHPYGVLETRQLPGTFKKPAMKSLEDFALPQEKLLVINPGPGEYVSVMEGQRHGYQDLTVGITYTAPGGAPPMHTHTGEEAHVLLEGEILYALGDKLFTISAPYIVNIPPMTPHSFVNIGNQLAELVVIFPTNVWEYDVLDYFPFKDLEAAKKRAKRVERGPSTTTPATKSTSKAQ